MIQLMSDSLRVDPVILTECAYEADINNPVVVIDPHDDSIFITRHIEYYPSVFQYACAAQIAFYLCRC